MNKKDILNRLEPAAVRALWTFLESVLACLTVGQRITDFDWANIVLISLTAAVITFIKSLLAGVPEVGAPEIGNLIVDDTDWDDVKMTLQVTGDIPEKNGEKVTMNVVKGSVVVPKDKQ